MAEGPMVTGFASEEEAIEAAKADALRRYTQPIKPMTLEEVRRESSAWLEVKNKRWKLRFIEMTKRSGGVVFRLAGSNELHGVLYDTYNKDWRCWERKPTDEERRAAEWKK